MKNKIYEIEIERCGVTPKQFWNYCKKRFDKKEIDMFIEAFEDFENPIVKHERNRHDDGCTSCVMPYEYQMYAPNAYNFIMIFDYYDGKTGFGYCYAVEYEED